MLILPLSLSELNVTALAGGVGGARLADGLARLLPAERFSVVVNTGDDFIHYGLRISPDLDTVCYTLAGMANPESGWGRAQESWQVFEGLAALSGETWFRLGDRDLATHLERTRRLAAGDSLSQVTRDFCLAWGVRPTVLPMSDHPVATIVESDRGELGFQDYFVRFQTEPRVTGFSFAGVEDAEPAPGVCRTLQRSDLILISPSNPWVSINPILAIAGIRESIRGRPVIAVSPIIGGKTVKGPAAKMFAELGIRPSALAVAEHYAGLVTGFVLDAQDEAMIPAIERLGISTFSTNILMKDPQDRPRLAAEILAFAASLLAGEKIQ